MPRSPIHPGAILREDALPALDLSVREAAECLGVSRQTLHKILAERSPITPEMAVRIGKLCGNGPEIWATMQTRYDLARAAVALADQVKRIPTKRAA